MIRKATDGARAARLAGESANNLPQWFGMEDATEERAAEQLRKLVSSGSLVHDPAAPW
jgi:hypothetical protein